MMPIGFFSFIAGTFWFSSSRLYLAAADLLAGYW
jgi:hypothetical protein